MHGGCGAVIYQQEVEGPLSATSHEQQQCQGKKRLRKQSRKGVPLED